MARLTAEKVKQMLNPMAQFAPAVMAASEIIAEAEQAERTVADAEAKLKAIADQVQSLNTQQAHWENQVLVARREYQTVRDKVEKDKAELQSSMKPLQAEREAAQAEILVLGESAAQMRVNMEAERQNLQRKIDKMKADFEQWKKEHQL